MDAHDLQGIAQMSFIFVWNFFTLSFIIEEGFMITRN
jgi:hypothetical protein